ncbi:MAG: fibronectin type III domain-containing protein, partial [Elusimicrobiales bacterium]|nr:fibronectin type III domain-containing protein [Elusimicrobiales bacterium]
MLPLFNDISIATMTFPSDSELTLTGAKLRVSSLTALGSIVLDSASGVGSVLEQTGLVQWTIGNLIVKSGSKITHKANTSDKLYALNMKILGDMTVEAGANIEVNGLGYAGGISGQNGSGLGMGYGSSENGGGGAGYGGSGGRGHGGTMGGISYGSIEEPEDLGSGGGGSNGVNGGSGGGQINLVVVGTLTVNGSLLAKGNAGITNNSYGAGGGAGGTIRIEAGNLEGLGIIDASGGNGGAGSVRGGGGGAGGRISGAHNFIGQVYAYGGSKGSIGAGNGQNGSYHNPLIIIPGQAEPTFYDVFVTSLTVAWNPNGNPAGIKYHIEISNADDFSGILISTITDNTFATFKDLNPNSIYHARVAGVSQNLIATKFTVLGSTHTSKKAGETWIGSSVGDWHNPDNWDNGAVPISTDPVTIANNVTVVTYSTNPPIEFGSLILGKEDGSVGINLILSTGTLLAESSVIINPGAIITHATLAPVKIGNILMKQGSSLAHKTNTSLKEYIVNLEVTNKFTMEAGSTINVMGLGYGPRQGPGGGSEWNSGGGYGGPGQGYYEGGGKSYGSIVYPEELGSGGYVVSGGGAVIIKAGGELKLDGLITVKGNDYEYSCGSGGSVNLSANILSGSGKINADGGVSQYDMGTGGGGRIAINMV